MDLGGHSRRRISYEGALLVHRIPRIAVLDRRVPEGKRRRCEKGFYPAKMELNSINARKIERRITAELNELIDSSPAVALIGPRQVGKTTLALAIGDGRPSVYLDLESDADRAKLAEPELYLAEHADKLVILDEVHRLPNLSQNLRGLIDRGRRSGKRTGRFLLLGSASIELPKQSGETLAGRIAYLEMHPIDGLELPAGDLNRLWVRGGFPDSFLAPSDRASQRWRQDFIRTYVERDIPFSAPAFPPKHCDISGRCWPTTSRDF